MDDNTSSYLGSEVEVDIFPPMDIVRPSELRRRWDSGEMSEAEARMWEREGLDLGLAAEDEFRRRMLEDQNDSYDDNNHDLEDDDDSVD